MKKVVVLGIALIGLTGFAQEKKEIAPKGERAEMESFTPEQREQLHIKKLTLELGLNETQQKEMAALAKEIREKRNANRAEKEGTDAKKPMTNEERLATKSKFLDEKIAYKEKVKKILTAEQFAKWEKMQEERKFRKPATIPATMGTMEDKK